MIERSTTHFGRLVFDRDAIVRAALRAYVETSVRRIARFWYPAADGVEWTGDLQRGAFVNFDGCLDYEVVAWTEVGVVGLALDYGQGPIHQLDLSVDAVTGGPDDVRGAVPGLPDDLEPALVLATSMLDVGPEYGEKWAGVGFWLCGDRIGGTLFLFHGPPRAWGAHRLAAWGLLHDGRLLPLSCEASPHPHPGKIVVNHARPQDAPAHAIMDAVVDRRLSGPTELTHSELETLLHPAPEPERLLNAQRMLQKVGITWPGSPEIPPYIDPSPNPYVVPDYLTRCFGPVLFKRDAIVRAALRAYVEKALAPLDPLARHVFTACIVPKWTGDLERGAFFNGDGRGDYDVVAWTEAGVVGLAYKRGVAPMEQLGAALPGLPDELLPALELAAGLLEVGSHEEKLASIGFWLYDGRAAGTLFDDPTLAGARRLVPWGTLKNGRLPLLYDRESTALAAMLARTTAAPIHALVDAVVDRRLHGPMELLPDELATLLPTPPDLEHLLGAQRMLQKVGITWPGSPEIPEPPQLTGRDPILPQP
jgi:hypothetical protein